MKKIKKDKKKSKIDIISIIQKVIVILIITIAIAFSIWAYFNICKPQERRFIKNSRYAYSEISKVIYEIYKEKGYIYDRPDEYIDSICKILAEKLSKDKTGNCTINLTSFLYILLLFYIFYFH